MNYFKYKQFNQDTITVAVDYYLRYALSYRDISEILRERGVNVHHSTVYRWVQEYPPILYQIWKKKNKKVYYRWHIDETYIKIKGKWCYLHHAIDADMGVFAFILFCCLFGYLMIIRSKKSRPCIYDEKIY
ncbi:IS6 family transposase [Staphylococcus simulans]|uniref:IS6 family transposase n=1 Tax=Staphylococcus simulans TaxID=1286 RepID=UPI0021D152CB|nr:IS6 family transposase [Staphylococcus simulans]